MKALISLFIALLVCTVAVSAIELPKGPCTWIRPATEYRPEREFTGVWGRYSDGSIRCFSPGSNKPKIIKEKTPVCTESTTTVEICETKELCEPPVCHWKWKCLYWKHYGCVSSKHYWICEEPLCHEITDCHEETIVVRVCN